MTTASHQPIVDEMAAGHAAVLPAALRFPLRARIARRMARTAAALSRVTGRGEGSAIGGRIGLLIDPNLLSHLARGRQTVLVSGTNGKTTTTKLIAAALRSLGPVASNSVGANMPSGQASALARAGSARYAVLEVDEHYLPQTMVATGRRRLRCSIFLGISSTGRKRW